MKKLTDKIIGFKTRLLGKDSRTVFLSAGCVVLILAGALWMLAGDTGGSGLEVLGDSFSPSQVRIAASRLLENKIQYQIKGSKILVKADDFEKASAIISNQADESGLRDKTGEDKSEGGFFAGQSLWLSESQNERVWHSRKMAELGRLISHMQPVEKAIVLYEPGKQTGLGNRKTLSTAAVHVTLKDEHVMTAQLVTAIGDLVSGSVSGLKPEDIKIVDTSGRSYVCDEFARELSRVNLLENEMSAKISAVLAGDISAAAECVYENKKFHVTVTASQHADPQKIKQSVLHLFNDRIAGVIVHQPVAAIHDERPANKTPSRISASAWMIYCGLVLAGGLLCGGFVRFAFKGGDKKHDSVPADQALFSEEQEFDEDVFSLEAMESVNENAETAHAVGPFDFLAGMDAKKILDCVREEKPQTLAVIMKHLSPQQVRGITAGLTSQWRDAVCRHMTKLEQVDPQIVEEIASAIASRMRSLESHVPDKPIIATGERFESIEFEDLMTIDSSSLENAIEAVNHDDLAISLRTAGREMKKKLFGCMSAATGRRVKRRMERIGPVRLCEVESARQRVVQAVSAVLFGHVPLGSYDERQMEAEKIF